MLCTNPGPKVVQETMFCPVAPITGHPLVRKLFKISILAPRIFEVVLYFCKICGPLM